MLIFSLMSIDTQSVDTLRMVKGPNRIPRCNCYLKGEKMLTDFGISAFILAAYGVRFQFIVL